MTKKDQKDLLLEKNLSKLSKGLHEDAQSTWEAVKGENPVVQKNEIIN